jgi:hypothetical protein
MVLFTDSCPAGHMQCCSIFQGNKASLPGCRSHERVGVEYNLLQACHSAVPGARREEGWGRGERTLWVTCEVRLEARVPGIEP